MGGEDKGLVSLGNRPMLAWVLERFAPQVDEVLISANRNLERYAEFGRRIVTDRMT
ncbi:MAG TPA: molybdenum cofactor guanylyltransferase, partial [Gammaproteobacteria bacterium]|nr:molybdenum cofactor guanylyltransferase [Gammaproteobacteria bacterium]